MPHGALFAIVVRARKHEGIEAVFDVPCKSNHEIILAYKALKISESADRRVIEGEVIFKGKLFDPQNLKEMLYKPNFLANVTVADSYSG